MANSSFEVVYTGDGPGTLEYELINYARVWNSYASNNGGTGTGTDTANG